MHQRDDCVFCRIVQGTSPCYRVYEDEQVMVFMDIFPVTDGHTLVITKEHFENLFEASAESLEAVARASKRVAGAIHEILGPDGLGVFQLNGAAAGQTVFHYHMHLMPRAEGSPLALQTRVPGKPERLQQVARALAAALG